MAASIFGHKEQPPKTKGTGHSQGVRIDSSLINTASSDVQNELSGLGVSVYNQDDFEAGVLQQIDREVTKRNAEQQRKFLMKEYSNVKHEISAVRLELNNLSKSIAGLLSHRLCDVVSELRERRASQERKRKQLLGLEAREQQLLRKLTGKDTTGDNDQAGEGSTPDVAFGIALGDQSSEQQRLIQTGLITPFGGRVEEATLDQGSLSQTSDLTAVKTAELAPENHLLMEPTSSCLLNAQETDATSSSSFQSDRTGSSQAVDSSVHSKDVNSTLEEEGKGHLRLSSDSFDGLFAEIKPVPSPGTLQKKTSGGKSESSGKGKQRTKLAIGEASGLQGERTRVLGLQKEALEGGSSGLQGECTRVLGLQKEALEGGSETWESLSDGLTPDGGEWVPSEGEGEESGESEYFTDEDLGGEGVGGVRREKGRHGRKRKLRELSSDDESEDELMSYRRRCKRRMTSAVRLGKHQDDGDEELYRMRIRQHEEEEEEEESGEPDAVFGGGFRVPGSVWHKLYRYQQTGVKWLWELHCQQAGGIVGDEMGLGKTIQMIAFLAGLKESNLRSHVTRKLGLGPVLIVCPATVMHQWVSEFHTWWAPFRVAVLHDTGTFVGAKRILVDRIVTGDGVLITTYAGIRGYRDLLLKYKWDYVILDEGHKIRNPDAEMTLTCKQFATPHRLILSGSPMQNNLRELWSLFDFVFPGKLGTLPVFMEQFSVPITLGGYANATEVQVQTAYRCACVLRDTINPYLLRRLKADVKIQLPSKNEQVLFCRLTDYQKELYEDFIHGPEVEMMLSGRKHIFSGLMTLRKLCNHPDLVTNDFSELVRNEKGEGEEGEEEEGDFEILNVPGRKKKKWPLRDTCRSEDVESEEMYGHWRRSGKMVVVESLLKLWKAQDHRALLFTQSKQMLNILERFVASRGYSYQRMDGGTPISTRQPLINKFNEDRSIFLFILTTRVGGLGVNLVGADRVLIYDPDWNPSTDTQARERAWRIGQTRQVTVYRLLTSGTIEEKIYHRQIFKQFLTNRVLKDPRQRRFFKSNDLSELFSLNSSSSEGSTETSAIFAGTGSEVVPNHKHVSREKSHDHSERISLAGSKRKPGSTSKTSEPKKKKKKRNHAEISLVDSNKRSCDVPEQSVVVSEGPSDAESQKTSDSVGGQQTSDSVGEQQTSDSVEGQQPLNSSLVGMDCRQASVGMEPGPSSPSSSKRQKKHKQKEKKNGDSKRKRRKRRKNAEVEGSEISGVDRTGRFEPGDNDEGALNRKQDDFILRKLFKKSGVHTALQHDTIMSSGDPDYVLVESEAKKVAQSAARAMRQSRQHCMVAGRWGRPTWTGQHGMIGVPQPRFGSKNLTTSTQGGTSNHFDGKSTGSVSRAQGSLNTSSSVLLAKMKKRNTHELPGRSGSGIHQDTHGELLAEMRDFIATQCRVDGQATTDEILGRFSCRLPPSSTAVFRSLLHEICDFSRYHGDGMWTLKPEFR